jgi:hypothetical protein
LPVYGDGAAWFDGAIWFYNKEKAVAALPAPCDSGQAERQRRCWDSRRGHLDFAILAVTLMRASPKELLVTKSVEARNSLTAAVLRRVGYKDFPPFKFWQQKSHLRICRRMLSADSRQYGVYVHDFTSASLLNSAAISASRPRDAC